MSAASLWVVESLLYEPVLLVAIAKLNVMVRNLARLVGGTRNRINVITPIQDLQEGMFFAPRDMSVAKVQQTRRETVHHFG